MNKVQKTIHIEPYQVAFLNLRGDLNMSGVIRQSLDNYIRQSDNVDLEDLQRGVAAIDITSGDFEEEIESYSSLDDLLSQQETPSQS
ncbi:hypothetical protein HLRTI_000409 [Halorhabdus tiamatea SARL4B]|uniref:Uncharacterized protein n=1 Tax=Halorhabdus tiamatea SARL4B TaxID=1033806 RepID=F7PMF0_9EURY|nr:hypothetical protein HLRTI_000409 [Halorhabdus tiamatea SARL4B]